MISEELETSLHNLFFEARSKRHEFITVEHLLLALLRNASAADALKACGADLDELHKSLKEHIAEHTPTVADGQEADTQPTVGFQRIIQHAIMRAQSAQSKEVSHEDHSIRAGLAGAPRGSAGSRQREAGSELWIEWLDPQL